MTGRLASELHNGYPDRLDGTFTAVCWCGAGYVRVTRQELLACTTRPCHRPACREAA